MSYDPVKAADKGDYYAEEQVPVQNCDLQKITLTLWAQIFAFAMSAC